MTCYQARPQQVEAVRWNGDNAQQLHDFLSPYEELAIGMPEKTIRVRTQAIQTKDEPVGTWFVKYAEGSTGTLDDYDFNLMFEPVESGEEIEGSD